MYKTADVRAKKMTKTYVKGREKKKEDILFTFTIRKHYENMIMTIGI